MGMYGHAGPGAMLGIWAILLMVQVCGDILVYIRRAKFRMHGSGSLSANDDSVASKDVELALLVGKDDHPSKRQSEDAEDEVFEQANDYMEADWIESFIGWTMVLGGVAGFVGEVGDGLYWGNSLWASLTEQRHGVHIPAYVAASLTGYFLLKYRVHGFRLGDRNGRNRRQGCGGFQHYEIVFWMLPPIYDVLLGCLLYFHKQEDSIMQKLHNIMAGQVELLAIVFFARRVIDYKLVQLLVARQNALRVKELLAASMYLKWLMAYLSAINCVWFNVSAVVTIPSVSILQRDGEDTDVTMLAVKYAIFTLLAQLCITAAWMEYAERKLSKHKPLAFVAEILVAVK